MEKLKKAYIIFQDDAIAFFLVVTAIVLVVVSLIAPPLGVIDNSVLIAVGELMLMLAIVRIGEKGSVKIQHKDTSVELSKKDEEE